jgi:hypothetical protein
MWNAFLIKLQTSNFKRRIEDPSPRVREEGAIRMQHGLPAGVFVLLSEI